MWKYGGHTITATRYHFILIGNDYEMTYQVVNSKSGQVVFQHIDEDECLDMLMKLSGIGAYDEKLLSRIRH